MIYFLYTLFTLTVARVTEYMLMLDVSEYKKKSTTDIKNITIHHIWKISIRLVSKTTANQTGFICHVPAELPPISHSIITLHPCAVCFGKSEGCFGLRTTVELLRSQRRHRSALQAAGVVAGGRSLSVARLGVLLEEVGQPQQLAVAVQGVGIQSPTHTHTHTWICTSKKKRAVEALSWQCVGSVVQELSGSLRAKSGLAWPSSIQTVGLEWDHTGRHSPHAVGNYLCFGFLLWWLIPQWGLYQWCGIQTISPAVLSCFVEEFEMNKSHLGHSFGSVAKGQDNASMWQFLISKNLELWSEKNESVCDS